VREKEEEEEEVEEGRVEFMEKKAREGGSEGGDDDGGEEKRECVRFLKEASKWGKRARRLGSSVSSLLLIRDVVSIR